MEVRLPTMMRVRCVASRWHPTFALVLFALLGLAAAPAEAAVEIGFHSKEFGVNFPHAFISLTGTVDATGEPVNADFGFTVRHLIGPSILFGRVEGVIISEGDSYVAGANRHFTMVLTDDQYAQILALVERWRALPQPSYSLERRNCVSFVAEVATLLGLQADPRGMMRRPKLFLDRVRELNLATIEAAAPADSAPAVAAPAVAAEPSPPEPAAEPVPEGR